MQRVEIYQTLWRRIEQSARRFSNKAMKQIPTAKQKEISNMLLQQKGNQGELKHRWRDLHSNTFERVGGEICTSSFQGGSYRQRVHEFCVEDKQSPEAMSY